MSDFSIDKYNLDSECLRQAELYNKYGNSLAMANYARDKSKDELNLLEAEIDAEIRAAPDEYGLPDRPTETAIKNTVYMDRRVVKKRKEYLEKSKEAAIMEGSKWAMEHKKVALELLVKLQIANYYAEPHISDRDKESVNKKEAEHSMMETMEENPRIK